MYRLENKGIKTIAAYMVIFKRNENRTDYYCIPHPKSIGPVREMFTQTLYDSSDGNNFYRNALIVDMLSRIEKW